MFVVFSGRPLPRISGQNAMHGLSKDADGACAGRVLWQCDRWDARTTLPFAGLTQQTGWFPAKRQVHCVFYLFGFSGWVSASIPLKDIGRGSVWTAVGGLPAQQKGNTAPNCCFLGPKSLGHVQTSRDIGGCWVACCFSIGMGRCILLSNSTVPDSCGEAFRG